MMNRHMKRHLRALGLFAAMVTLSAQMAAAAITSDDVIASYRVDGFTRVEVRVGLTQMKVEAIKGTTKVETIYDIATGAVLKTETETVRAGENTAPGVSVRERNRDFVRAGGSSDDDGNDDRGRGRGGDDDDDSDDDHGGDRDRSNDDDDDHNDDSRDDDDDHGDDHGGDRDSSNDDDDDNGGDRDDDDNDDEDHGGDRGESDDD